MADIVFMNILFLIFIFISGLAFFEIPFLLSKEFKALKGNKKRLIIWSLLLVLPIIGCVLIWYYDYLDACAAAVYTLYFFGPVALIVYIVRIIMNSRKIKRL